jgi:hypothetical protein
MRARTLVILAALAVAAVAAWRLWPGEERKIRGRLDALAAELSIPAGEAGLARVARAAGLRAYFTRDVTVEMPAGEGQALHGREELAGIMARMPVPAEGTRVELLNVDIQVGPEKASADVRLNARVTAREPKENPTILDGRMVALSMVKLEGAWVIANARVMPTDDALGVR